MVVVNLASLEGGGQGAVPLKTTDIDLKTSPDSLLNFSAAKTVFSLIAVLCKLLATLMATIDWELQQASLIIKHLYVVM